MRCFSEASKSRVSVFITNSRTRPPITKSSASDGEIGIPDSDRQRRLRARRTTSSVVDGFGAGS